MKDVIYAEPVNENDSGFDHEIVFPDLCPYCQKGIQPIHLASYYTNPLHFPDKIISSMFLCPVCERIFVGIYTDIILGDTSYPKNVIPSNTFKRDFSSNIETLSPKFCQIYNESLNAENQGLTEICGMGYRKALEFLVKDFAISENPDDEESIKSKMLSNCISDHIDNKKIQTLAKASAWLGNDETHYVRKHEDYDLNNLKSFINATVSYLDSELELKKAEALLSSK
ncbi:MAG: DUF4145 domain-containing protein [Ruminococcus sp.]|nr:DUF4145 domain-containing protein [Ruminococcus sp.]